MGWDADDARDAAQAASWSERQAALAEVDEWDEAELERVRVLKMAAEDWAQEAARRLDFLRGAELALYRAVRALDGEA